MSEWVEWHEGYAEGKPLALRLRIVQQLISEALDQAGPGSITAISLCAGDGRDLLGVMESHPRGRDVRARLVELDPDIAQAGRAAAQPFGDVEFVTGDASLTDAYVGFAPVSLVLICGVFGNITDDDVHRAIDALPQLCDEGGIVIWTRGMFEPDLTPAIRRWLSEAGFSEVAFVPIAGTSMAVGAHRLDTTARPLRSGRQLFTFLAKEDRPSTKAMGSKR